MAIEELTSQDVPFADPLTLFESVVMEVVRDAKLAYNNLVAIRPYVPACLGSIVPRTGFLSNLHMLQKSVERIVEVANDAKRLCEKLQAI